MREIGITFSGELPQKIRDGLKTETRRVLNPQPPSACVVVTERHSAAKSYCNYVLGNAYVELSSDKWRVRAGDLLYVREACWRWGRWVKNGKTKTGAQKYEFDPCDDGIPPVYVKPIRATVKRDGSMGWVYRHARFMPKAQARTWLKVTAVSVERLHEITEAGARAEGVEPTIFTQDDVDWAISDAPEDELLRMLGPGQITAKYNFQMLWDEVNGRGSWKLNPWVMVIRFERQSK